MPKILRKIFFSSMTLFCRKNSTFIYYIYLSMNVSSKIILYYIILYFIIISYLLTIRYNIIQSNQNLSLCINELYHIKDF